MNKKINSNPYDGLLPIVNPNRAPNGIFIRKHDPEVIWPKLLDLISSGHALTTALREISNAPSYPWCKAQLRNNLELKQRYKEAMEDRADYRANEILEIADTPLPCDLEIGALNAWVQHQRLRIDARKWIAARLSPKNWGDKVDVTVNANTISIRKALEDANQRVIQGDASKLLNNSVTD